MNLDQAMEMAVELASAYPGRGIGEATLSQYAAEFLPASHEQAVLAIGDLVQQFTDRAPSLGQLREALRIRNPQPELPPHEDIGYSRKPMTGKDVDHWRHGRFHLAELLSVPADQRTEAMREIAQHPDRCSCPKRAGAAEPSQMIRELAGETA